MSQPNAAQADYWNSAAGREWVTQEIYLDAALSTILRRLVERTDIQPGQHLLDVGCGTGASTLAAAELTGNKGHVTGLDIAPHMLTRAQQRVAKAGLQNVRFILADAETEDFAVASYDGILSRFGFMFFANPAIALANMAKALKPKGRMTFVAWAPAAVNPWFSIPHDAAVQCLGKPSVSDPTAPGPLAFQDVDRVSGLMHQAGLVNVCGETELVNMTPMGTVRDVADIAARIGPAARIMKEYSATPADAAAIKERVMEAFATFEQNGRVIIPAAVNFFSAAVP